MARWDHEDLKSTIPVTLGKPMSVHVHAVGDPPLVKVADTGMVREDKTNKPTYLQYFTPAVLKRYAERMKQFPAKYGLPSDNWKQGGYPKEEYLESLMRHLVDLYDGDTSEDHAAGIMFNIVGYMHEQHLEKLNAAQ